MHEKKLEIFLEILHQMGVEPTILFLGDSFSLKDIKLLFSQPWSCVYTTLREKSLSSKFETANRRATDVTVVADSKTIHLDRQELSVVRLYGIDPDELDPIDQMDTMQVFLETIPQLLRSYGRILIEGLTNMEAFPQIYTQLSKIARIKSVYFFGATEEIVANPYVSRLLEKGIAVAIPESLTDLISELSVELGEFGYYAQTEDGDGEGPTIFIRKTAYKMTSPLDKELLLNVKGFARLLNYEEVELADTFTREEMIQRFQSFLQNSTIGFPRWYAYREYNGFHLERYFEEDLYNRTIKILKDAASKDRRAKPIMLRGQACCGKTNALCALAYRIFHEGQYPVVFIPNSDVNFKLSFEKNDDGDVEKKKSDAFTSLEHLLRQIESKSSNPIPTLILWDTSCRTKNDISNAADLLLALRDAGRLVQIVCTGYGVLNSANENNPYAKYNCIDINIALQKTKECDEVALVRNLLIEKGGFRPEDATRMMKYYSASDNFLGSLYLFRELHKNLKGRLRRESEYFVEDINCELDRLSKEYAEESINNVMAAQMLKVVEKFRWQISLSVENDLAVEQSTERKGRLENLICCIALCTIYKERLPISLALRLLGNIDTDSSKVFGAVMNNSLLVHSISENNEPLVYIRSELEANLLLEEYGKLPMDIIFCLLDNILPSGDFAEIVMMQNLIRLIGPNNRQSTLSLWPSHIDDFELLVNKLRKFREAKHSDDFLIQELTLTREICSGNLWLDDNIRVLRLREAVDLANKAINKLDLTNVDNHTANLFVEWALLYIRLSKYDSSFSKEDMFQDISKKMNIVIRRFPKKGYAYSAYLWAGLKYAETIEDQDEIMDLLQKLSLIRDVLEHEVDDENIDTNVIGELDGQMDSIELSEERFERSIREGKSYGIYFKVRQLIGTGKEKLDFSVQIGKDSAPREKCKQIIELLNKKEYQNIVKNDASCMYTLINVMWLFYSGQPIVPSSENQCIGMDSEKWEELYVCCMRYLEDLCIVRSPRILYLHALCAAHLPKHRGECIGLFEELRKSIVFEKRSLHVISDETGKPQLFNGRLSGKYNTYENKGYIRLDGLGFREPIYFRAEKIGRSGSGLRENMQLIDLSVTTSFTGFQICKL